MANKKVDITLENAYQLNSLGYVVTCKNGHVLIEKEC